MKIYALGGIVVKGPLDKPNGDHKIQLFHFPSLFSVVCLSFCVMGERLTYFSLRAKLKYSLLNIVLKFCS